MEKQKPKTPLFLKVKAQKKNHLTHSIEYYKQTSNRL